MSSNAIRAVAVIMVLLAVILALFGYRYAQRLASNDQAAQQQNAQPQSSVPQTLVVVATKPLAVNKPIDRDSIALVPVQVAPTEYFTNVEDVVKRTPLVDIDAGAPVTPRFFKENNILARSIPPGHLALSLKVDDVVGAGGFARPGDVVDVLLYIRSVTDTPTGEKGKDSKADIATQARFLLKNALILSYEDHLVESPKGIDEKDKEKQQQNAQRRERTAVIAVPENDVTRVMLGASLGELRLALHPQGSALATAEPPPAAAAATPAAAPADATTATAVAGAGSTTPATAPAPAPPATSTAAVSAMPAATADAAASPTLPLSDAEKAKAEAAKVPDMVITAAELGKVQPSPEAEKKKKIVAAKPRIEIFRGSAHEQTVYP